MIPFIFSFISFSMYSFYESLIPFSSTITLPDTPFRQFDPVISYPVCFAIKKISFWCSGSFRSLVHSFCFFSSAEEITLFALCLHFLYSIHASFEFSLFHFLYFIFFSLTASATSSFHHHVSLCLQGPFDIPHVLCCVRHYLWDTCRFRVLIGNNGAIYFNTYPEPHNHAHSLRVYF